MNGSGAESSSSRLEKTYGSYLRLERILGAQAPTTDAHDELLFIIQHQTSELWMKLAIHEIRAARESLRADKLQPAFKMLTRVARIFEQLNSAWNVLRTMTPSEYTRFREGLGRSSGFQSHQYREIEFLVGHRQQSHLLLHEGDPSVHERLSAILVEPSLYDEALGLLMRHGFQLPSEVTDRDLARPHRCNAAVTAVWRRVYEAPEAYWPLYELAEKLVDFEDYFRRWRFNHVTTVERIIGMKRGTGGTEGVAYLRRMLEVELFPELWQVRTEL
ncbi:MAG: tryptophan 2,3-dioxygenase [Geminicoccaceae bacterium]